jgi:endo-1,4-beta-xylanase
MTTQERDPQGLGALARQHGFEFGAAVQSWLLSEEPFAETLAREFSCIVAENTMKMGPTLRAAGVWCFENTDPIADFARANGQTMRGHTLLWHNMNPKWVLNGGFNRKQLLDIVHDHIFEMVPRYKDVVTAWDVVNEVVELTDGSLHDTFWLRGIGPDYIERAFRWARRADPECKLFYNDWVGEGEGRDWTLMYDFLRRQLDQGVPIDGVGLQMHLPLEELPACDDIEKGLDRFESLGLEIHITELDVKIKMPASPGDYDKQAEVYGWFARLVRERKSVTSLVVWGVTDKHSCHNEVKQGYGDALLFDRAYNPKPAYHAMREAWS